MNKRKRRYVSLFLLVIIGLIIILVCIMSLYVYYAQKLKYNSFIEYETAEEYYENFMTNEYNISNLDDLLYSMYTKGYKDEFIQLYEKDVEDCFNEEKCDEVSISSSRARYLIMLSNLSGDIDYINTNSDIDYEYSVDTMFSQIDMTEYELGVKTIYICDLNRCGPGIDSHGKVSEDTRIEEQYNDLQNILKTDVNPDNLVRKYNIFGLNKSLRNYAFDVNIIYKDGTVELKNDILVNTKFYEMNVYINYVNQYYSGNDKQKHNAEIYLSKYYGNVESNLETYLRRISGKENVDEAKDLIKKYTEEDYIGKAILDIKYISNEYLQLYNSEIVLI